MSTPSLAAKKAGDNFLEKSFIFIAGHHRSGTSLLHRILRDHPQISGFRNTGAPEDEGQHLQSVYKPAKELGGAGRYIFNANARMDESHELANKASAKQLFQSWSQHWDTQLPWLLEKSPPNLVKTRFLQKLFPNSVFIGITRHPIAVSYATQKWCQCDISSLLDHTLLGYETMASDSGLLKRFYLLKYEDFVSDPQFHIDNLLAYLGLPSQRIRQTVAKAINDHYFDRWQWDRVNKGLMSELMLEHLEGRCRKFGYSLSNPHDQ